MNATERLPTIWSSERGRTVLCSICTLGFEVAAEDKDGEAVLVDATPFFLSDAHEVAARLAAVKQGAYHVDLVAAAIYLPRTKNFPENTDVNRR